MLFTKEIVGGFDISSPILPRGEVWMIFVVGHWDKVEILRHWQFVMEATGNVHGESNKVAGMVHLIVLIIIVGLLILLIGGLRIGVGVGIRVRVRV